MVRYLNEDSPKAAEKWKQNNLFLISSAGKLFLFISSFFFCQWFQIQISSCENVHICYFSTTCVWRFWIANQSNVRSHICLFICWFVCVWAQAVCARPCARVRARRVEWMLWAFLHEGGVCWNVEFGHAADALPLKTLQTEWTDGRPSGRARGVGFALRPWESLWLTSPARGADVTGLNGSERNEKLKRTRCTELCAIASICLTSCLGVEKRDKPRPAETDSVFKFRAFKHNKHVLYIVIFLRMCAKGEQGGWVQSIFFHMSL